MNQRVAFDVTGKAEPGGSKRPGISRATGKMFVRDDNRNVKEWRRRVADAAGEATVGLLEGPLRLTVRFVVVRPNAHMGTGRNAGMVKPGAPPYPTTRPDLTKLLRAIEDALTGVVWRDDAQVVQQSVTKVYAEADEPARCEVAVEPVPFTGQEPGA